MTQTVQDPSFTNALHEGGFTFLWTAQTGFTSQFINQQDPPLPISNAAATQLQVRSTVPNCHCPMWTAALGNRIATFVRITLKNITVFICN